MLFVSFAPHIWVVVEARWLLFMAAVAYVWVATNVRAPLQGRLVACHIVQSRCWPEGWFAVVHDFFLVW